MAKKGSSLGGWLIIGLLVLGISQCFKSPDRTSRSAVARTPMVTPAPTATKSSAPTLAAPPPAEANTTIEIRFVTASSLNVRSSPSTSGELVGKIPNGHQIAVVEKSNGWLLVQSAAAARGWVSGQYTSTSRPVALAATPPQPAKLGAPAVNRDAIIQKIIERSIRNYSGNCPCPYNTMRNGRRCGGNSAYSKPGGRSPICYPSDVTAAMIAAFR